MLVVPLQQHLKQHWICS